MASISKKELDLCKAYLSSLFARRQKYLWIDTLGETTTWYFSTIGTEMPDGQKKPGKAQSMVPIFAYTPNIEDFIHRVEFKDWTVPELLLTLVPCISGKTVCIHIAELLALINKGLVDEMCVNEEGVTIKKTIGKKDPVDTTVIYFTDKITMDFLIGQCKGIINKVVRTGRSMEIEITDPKVIKRGQVSFIELPLVHPNDQSKTGKLKLPVLDGCSIVSLPEFLSKAPGAYKLSVHAAFDMLALRAVPEFVTDSIQVLSVQPSAIWFPSFR